MTKTTIPKLYFCKYLGYAISGVAARNCNYSNLETNTCNHDEKPCVAKEGLELFAQISPLCKEGKLIDFQKAKEAHDQAKRTEAYDRIGHLADHLFPPKS